MSLTVQDMQQHIIGLCSKHEITYTWCRRPSQAWAAREIEEICIPPIKSPISYATALHEIGHILGRYQQSSDSMVRERWAWQGEHVRRANKPRIARGSYRIGA
jgi:hypothetical protein